MDNLLDSVMTEQEPTGAVDHEIIENTSLPVDAPQRPDGIPEQFWDTKTGTVRTEALAKSYSSLRNKFNLTNNDKPGKSPDDYMTEGITTKLAGLKDRPEVKAALQAAKDAGLGVKQAEQFIDTFIENLPKPKELNVKEELQALGKNGMTTIKAVKTWLDAMVRDDELSQESYDALASLGETANGIKALNLMRQKSMEMQIPTGTSMGSNIEMGKDEWYQATYKTHAMTGETEADYNDRMHNIGKKIFNR